MKRHSALVPLSRQHHDGLALGVFIERGLRPDKGSAAAERLREQALDLWELELRGHFEVEESVLFPTARDAIGDPELVDELLAEHEAVRGCFARLVRVEARSLPEELRDLRSRLVAHIRREEHVLFEAVQASLGEDDLVLLGRRIQDALPAACVRLGSAAGRPGPAAGGGPIRHVGG